MELYLLQHKEIAQDLEAGLNVCIPTSVSSAASMRYSLLTLPIDSSAKTAQPPFSALKAFPPGLGDDVPARLPAFMRNQLTGDHMAGPKLVVLGLGNAAKGRIICKWVEEQLGVIVPRYCATNLQARLPLPSLTNGQEAAKYCECTRRVR